MVSLWVEAPGVITRLCNFGTQIDKRRVLCYFIHRVFMLLATIILIQEEIWLCLN